MYLISLVFKQSLFFLTWNSQNFDPVIGRYDPYSRCRGSISRQCITLHVAYIVDNAGIVYLTVITRYYLYYALCHLLGLYASTILNLSRW